MPLIEVENELIMGRLKVKGDELLTELVLPSLHTLFKFEWSH
jgi:hypothetical protein